MKKCLVLVAALVGLQSCSSGETRPLCTGRTSVPDYVLRFGQGLANFDDDTALTLEADSVSVLDVVLAARDHDETREPAEALSARIGEFIGVMNSHDWIISEALDDQRAVSAADALGTQETLRDANTVEALVLNTCGVSPTMPAPVDSVETLPPPSFVNPSDTVPDTGIPDDVSDATALGRAIAVQFGLALTQSQVECLGSELQTVSDGTGAMSSPEQYEQQFQAAFDACGIDHKVAGP